MSAFAWVTLATNDSYSLGALVLAHSLRRANTAHQMAILITPGVSEAMRTQLSAVYNIVQVVDVLDSRDETNLTLLARPELGITFTKLHCWRLTQFSKCVFLDADTLVLQNCDELFEREELSAAPDAGWPDCFNSGVFVFQPSNDTFKKLMEFAVIHGSFDGGDQGLLNLYYKDWSTKDISKHLPFVYNMCSTATYSYLPAFKQFGENLKIIHFIGSAKPWLQVLDTETGLARVSGESYSIGSFIQLWWDLFCTHVHTSLSTEMDSEELLVQGGLAGALATLTLGSPLSPEQTALQEHLRRQGWEQGNIDYMGRDSFDNIWRKISETLNVAESEENVLKAEELPPVSELPDSSAQPLIPIVCELPPKSLSSVEPKLQTPPATPPVPSPVILPAASAPAIPSPSTPTPPPVSDSPSSPVSTPTTPTVAAPPSPPVTAPPTPSVAPVTASATTPVDPPVNILSTPISSPTLPSLPPVASQYAPEPPKSKPAPLLPASKPERSLTKITSPPQSPISPPPQKPSQPSPLTPPSSPKTEMPISKSIQPSTPTVTSPTPPTSPPVDPFDPTLSTKLKVDPETPGTPPAGAQPSTPTGSTDEPPVPPKRKGAKSVQEQQASKTQPKGGKPGKGKK